MTVYPFIILISGLLIILWIYTAISKLINFGQFNHALMTQVFPKWFGRILLYFLPFLEIGLAILLVIPGTRLFGMYASMFLMILFTLYVGGAVFKIYDRQPCACGGLFGKLGWYKHFKVNILLTVIALIGVVLMEL